MRSSHRRSAGGLLSHWLIAVATCLAIQAGPATAELKVVATIKPIHSLVAQVMGATGTPDLLVAGNASPHSFIMKPSDGAKLSKADIVFRVSETVEPFTTKIGKLLPKSTRFVTLQSVPGLATLPRRAGGPFDAHDDHDHGHDDHGAIDGHVWLDPSNAKAMLDAIAATLTDKDPQQAAAYATNATAAKARIDLLSADLARDLAQVAGQPYVVFHDAYQYFEKRFGLTVVGSITVNPDLPPSGKRLSALRAKISKLGATCVFGEPNFDGKVIASITEGTPAKTGTLDPEGASLTPGADLYDTLMRRMAGALRGCLQPAS